MTGGIDESHEKPVRLAALRAEMWTRYLTNMKQEC
jgi:hypothetical protein